MAMTRILKCVFIKGKYDMIKYKVIINLYMIHLLLNMYCIN